MDGDRIGLTGVSAGGFTSLQAAFHESGFDSGGIRGVATEIARPLTAPSELDVPVRVADVPLFMANNVDDTTTQFGPADAFWLAASSPKYRWLEDTPEVVPDNDHGFSTPEPFPLLTLFLDAYVKGVPAARAELDAFLDPASPELTYQAVPASIGFRGALTTPLQSKGGRTIPIELQLYADVGNLQATITPGVPSPVPLQLDRMSGTYQGLWRTKGLAAGQYQVSVVTSFGTFTTFVTLR